MKTIKDTISFHDFKTLVKENKTFGFVIMGAGGDIQEWLTGIEEILKRENVVTQEGDTFSRVAKLTGNVKGEDGRTDYVFLFTDTAKPEVGRLAIWRLTFGGISWMDDFVDNFSKDYKDGIPEEETSPDSPKFPHVHVALAGEDADLCDLIEKFQDQEKLFSFEGDRGVERLNKIITAIGYKGHQFLYGSPLEEFLSDNSGAIQSLIKWIGERDVEEWKQAVRENLNAQDEEEED